MTLDRQPLLEGELVRVRALREDDYDALWAISSDPLLWEQHPAKERATPDGFRQWFLDAQASGGALTVIDAADDEIVGTSRYDRYDPVASVVEIGWTFIACSHWGTPYNADLKRVMLDHAFGSVQAVLFRVHGQNFRSQRAVEKLGAVRSATETDPRGFGEVVVFRLER